MEEKDKEIKQEPKKEAIKEIPKVVDNSESPEEVEEEKPKKIEEPSKVVDEKPKQEIPKVIISNPKDLTAKDVEEIKNKLDEMIESKEHPLTLPSIEYFRQLAETPPEKRPKVMPARMKRVKIPKLLREKPKTKPTDPKHPLPRSKIAIVGFADTTRLQAPFIDPTYEIWGLNELYMVIPRADRWFEIHAENNIKHSFRDPKHFEWLKKCKIPVYMPKMYKEIPTCKVYPIDLMKRMFGPIFSSSIAEMMALAIYEGFQHIGLYGVDMALGKEFGAQKSGCEYFIGLAIGLGIEVYLPQESDLMKVGFQYGYDDPNEFAIKMKEKNIELMRKIQGATQQERATHDGKERLEGAKELNDYYINNFVQMQVERKYKHQ